MAFLEAAAWAKVGELYSDDFNGDSLNGDLWTFVTPLGDGQVSVEGGSAYLHVPAGSNHEVWTTGNHSSRIVQSMPDDNFEIEARFSSSLEQRFQMQGFVVEQDDDNFLRFELYSDGNDVKVLAAVIAGSTAVVETNELLGITAPYYLRLSRQDPNWVLSASSDGETWEVAAAFAQGATVRSVGVFAGNYDEDGAAPAFTAVVDYFTNTAAPVIPDGPNEPAVATNRITRCRITAKKDRNSSGDSLSISAVFPELSSEDIVSSDSIYLAILNSDFETIYDEVVEYDPNAFKANKLRYKGARGGVTSLKLNVSQKTCVIEAKNINLTGLSSPLLLQLQVGDYSAGAVAADEIAHYMEMGADAEDVADVINGKKPIPMYLLRGYADALRVDKWKVGIGIAENDDFLKVKGALATKDISADLTHHDIEISWGTFSITLPAENMRKVGETVFKYAKPTDAGGLVAGAVFNLEKCMFNLVIKKANIEEQESSAGFAIKFGQFNQSVQVD